MEERAHMLAAAPYMNSSLPIMIPVYHWWQVPYFYAGAKAYDLVSFNKELWQEDWVKTFGWYALNPCCYTDFKIREYFVNLINYKKNDHNNFLRYTSYNDEKNFLINFTFYKIRPRIFNLFFSYFYNNLLSLIKKFFKQ